MAAPHGLDVRASAYWQRSDVRYVGPRGANGQAEGGVVVDCTSRHAPTRGYLYQGMYALHLEGWFKAIPASARYIIGKSEDFFAKPGRFLDEMSYFLDLPNHGYAQKGTLKKNLKGTCSLKRCIADASKRAMRLPAAQALKQLEAERRRVQHDGHFAAKCHAGTAKCRARNQTFYPCRTPNTCRVDGGKWLQSKLKMNPQLEADLAQFYRPHNQRLYALLGRDLGWEKELREKKARKPPANLQELLLRYPWDKDELTDVDGKKVNQET